MVGTFVLVNLVPKKGSKNDDQNCQENNSCNESQASSCHLINEAWRPSCFHLMTLLCRPCNEENSFANHSSVVDVVKLFWISPKFRNRIKFVLMSEPSQKCNNNAILSKTILKNFLFLLKYPILAVLALGEI